MVLYLSTYFYRWLNFSQILIPRIHESPHMKTRQSLSLSCMSISSIIGQAPAACRRGLPSLGEAQAPGDANGRLRNTEPHTQLPSWNHSHRGYRRLEVQAGFPISFSSSGCKEEQRLTQPPPTATFKMKNKGL